MEYTFFKGKSSIMKKECFEVFKSTIAGLTQKSYLSLLLKYAFEQGVSQLDKYLDLLLKQGADINFTQSKSKSRISLESVNLLMNVCKGGDLKTVEMLVKQEDIHIFKKDKNNKNIVHYAIQNPNQENSIDIASFLLQQYPQLRALGDFRDGNYLTLCIRTLKLTMLDYLLSNQIEIDCLRNEPTAIQQCIYQLKGKHLRLAFIKMISYFNCLANELNTEQQNYVSYAFHEQLISPEERTQIMGKLKEYNQVKVQTLQTSPQEEKQQDAQCQNQISASQNAEQQQEEEQYMLDHALISQQMFEFATQMQQARNNTWQVIHPFYTKLYYIVAQLYGTLQVIGSFASNLWISNCDIDLLIVMPQSSFTPFNQIVDILYSKIRKLGQFSYSQIYFGYKLPMIKLILGAQYNHLQLQIFLSSKKNICSRYVSFVHQVVAYYPQIQIIYFVVRKILQARLLHDHKQGGLKAYALFLLIYSMRSQYNYQYISQFLQHFAYYYGLAYEYPAQVVNGQVGYKMNILDPLNNDNNMGGKKTDVLSLQQVFKKVYYGLNLSSEGNKIDFIIDLIKHT